jgi:ABC-type transport system substrate-binding protein
VVLHGVERGVADHQLDPAGRDDFLNGDAIGSGRWLLDGHDDGANIRLRKFPNWREPGLPRLDGVDNVFIPENASAQASFGAGDLDVITALTRLEVEELEGRLGDQMVRTSDLSRAFRTLMLKYEPPFDDVRVRHGINLALNRQEIMQGIDLGDGELCGPVPPAHQRYLLDASELDEYFRHDPAEGRSLLEAADFPFDQEFELKFANLESSTQLAQLIQQQLSDVGVRLKLTTEDLLTVWLPQTLNQGQFQLTCFTHLAYEDPDLPLRFYLSSTADINNFMDYTNEDVDAAILAAAQELDEERRVELTKEAQRVIIDDYAPMLNLYSPISYGGRYAYVKESIDGRGSYALFNSRIWLDK